MRDQGSQRKIEVGGSHAQASTRQGMAFAAYWRARHAVARGVSAGREAAHRAQRAVRAFSHLPTTQLWRRRGAAWANNPVAGSVVLVGGLAAVTLLIAALDAMLTMPMPNPGTLYLPLVAMLAYHWGWRYAVVGALFELACVYFFFLPPVARVKPLQPLMLIQLAVLAFVTVFVLALVQLARSRRHLAEREAGRFAALNEIGNSLTGELHEQPLLGTIAATARDLTGAEFAAFTLRPVDERGKPRVPAEGNLFHLAAVVGVSDEQEALFRRMPLGGEGVLAPIFRHGVPVRVADVLSLGASSFHSGDPGDPGDQGDGQLEHAAQAARPSATRAMREAAREAAGRYATDGAHSVSLRYIGVPRGHPVARSFLGVPLLDSDGEVRGGLLLGHSLPDHFTAEDQQLLVGLAAQAGVALENARLYRAARTQAQELDATFESISDGVMLVNVSGQIVRENGAARQLREVLFRMEPEEATATRLREVATRALAGIHAGGVTMTIPLGEHETREYVITGAPLWRPTARGDVVAQDRAKGTARAPNSLGDDNVVVVWHDVTATNRLLEEQQARADVEARQALLQLLIEELPSGVYLVRGPDARLVLANHAAQEVWGAVWSRGEAMVDFLRASGTRIFGPDGRELAADDLVTVRAARTGVDVRHHQEVIRQPNGTSLPILLNAVALDPRTLHLNLPAFAEAPAEATAANETEASDLAALVVLQDVTALKETERLKDEFIGVAAHELRTPLAALKGYAEMLTLQSARGKGQPLDAWQREALDAIDQATVRLVDLIDDLLDVTRLQGGRLQLRMEPHDLVALVRRVVRRLAVTDDHHHITIEAEADFVVACVDPPRVEQIVSNLLSNAIKYSPMGEDITIGVRDDQATGEAIITVRDHGIGIPAAQQAQIFGRFMRADNARDLGIAGTGLGLYLSRELAERHGGHIWFDSQEGQGTTFAVALPIESATREAATAPLSEDTERTGE